MSRWNRNVQNLREKTEDSTIKLVAFVGNKLIRSITIGHIAENAKKDHKNNFYCMPTYWDLGSTHLRKAATLLFRTVYNILSFRTK